MTWTEFWLICLGVVIVSMMARIVKRQVESLGANPANVPDHGATTILTLWSGRKAYVGRSGARVWIQMPSLEQGFTPVEARGLAQAIEAHSVNALAWEAMEKTPIKKAA